MSEQSVLWKETFAKMLELCKTEGAGKVREVYDAVADEVATKCGYCNKPIQSFIIFVNPEDGDKVECSKCLDERIKGFRQPCAYFDRYGNQW